MAGPHRIRMNYPYRGASNGLTRDLRRRLGERYLGIELELNHGAFFDDPAAWSELQSRVVEGVAEAITRRFGNGKRNSAPRHFLPSSDC